jgi:DNA-binding Lrp family transcriptional regulator
MSLKPQDVVVALKLCTYSAKRPSFSQIALELAMSPSEVHAAVKRLKSARLLHRAEMDERPNISALEEFLIHGLKYSFPAERGEITRGVLTSYAAEPLRHEISPGSEPPPVWPYAEGHDRGVALQPLYKTVPLAALRDPVLYEYLALVDAIRDGRSRERKIAERELSQRLRKSDVNAQPTTAH